MKVHTIIEDVLSDGIITGVSFCVKRIITITLVRSEPDDPFTIKKLETISKDEQELSLALELIQSTMRGQGIKLLIPLVKSK